jgi:hypothetical protein
LTDVPYLYWQEAEPGVREEDVARLVSLGYSEAMVRVALTNEDNSLERAAEALAANNGILEQQVALRSFFLFFLPNHCYVLGDVTRRSAVAARRATRPSNYNFSKLFFFCRSCLASLFIFL